MLMFMTKMTIQKKLDLFILVKNVKLIIIEDNTQLMKNIMLMVILILNN